MKISEVKTGEFVKLDELIMHKLVNGEFDCALPGSKLKSGSLEHLNSITVKPATREEFIYAVNKASHDNDWYSLLLKEIILKRL